MKSIFKAIRKNYVSIVLILTVFINIGYDLMDIPNDVRVTHWDGSEGVYLWWYGFFTKQYILGHLLIALIIALSKGLSRDVSVIYLCIDVAGHFSYQYQGWPEPKYFMINMFSVGIVLICFITFLKWKSKKY